MVERYLEASVRRTPAGAVVDLRGEIDGFAEEARNAAWRVAERGDAEVVLFSFAYVDSVNSAGIALIVGLRARARAGRRRLLACGLSEHYVEIFTITRLADFMTVYPSEAAALHDVPAPTP